jgi:hypothetical protein
MQMFCQKLLLPAIEAKIAALTQGGAEGERA